MTDEAVRARARRWGIEVRWEDTQHQLHDVSPEVLTALLDVLGDEEPDPPVVPVVIAEPGRRCVVSVRGTVTEASLALDPRSVAPDAVPAVAVSAGAAGSTTIGFDRPLPVGRHRVDLVVDGVEHRVTILAPPATTPRHGGRSVAVFAPCYSLVSPRGHGVGDLRDLDDLAVALHPSGVEVVSTLPLYATFTTGATGAPGPFDPSPYAPVSRRHWNELYADLEALPGPDGAPALAGLPVDELAALRAGDIVDWRGVARAVHATLDRALAVPAVLADVLAAAAADPDLADYARFRAIVERDGAPPAPGAALDADLADASVRRHLLGQMLMRRQLAALRAGWSARGQALALDLPVGSHGAGYEVWRHAREFAVGAAVGAPPDDFFVEGQCWGFPPLHPTRSRTTGHGVWHDVVDAAAAQAGILRIDHVMAVHRLWWIPDGAGAGEGAYVHYRSEELWALLAITAHLRGCTIVGEDLGTVPDEVAAARRARNVLGMYEEQFTIDRPDATALPEVPDDVVAGIRTHDMMPFRAFATGADAALRRDLGVQAPEGSDPDTRSSRLERWRSLAAAELGHPVADDPRSLFEAVLERLAVSAAPVVSVDLDDMLGVELPHNVPGVPQYDGAWARRLPCDVADAVGHPDVQGSLAALGQWRRSGAGDGGH